MDLSDINKLASRKRVNTEAEKLREKMSRESSKIIKLKVAQDTAYWELQERLGGERGQHQRLQRDMLDLQAQHEALSARLQRERCERPAVGARLAASRALADELHAHAARLGPALARAAADRDALAASYEGAARRVRAAHAQHHAAAEAARRTAAAAADRANLSAQLATCAETARRHAAEALGDARARLRAAADAARDLRAQADDRRARAAAEQAALREAERARGELRREAELRAAEAAAGAERAAATAAAAVHLQRRLEESDAALLEARRELAAAEERERAGAEQAERRRDELRNLERNRDHLRRELRSVGEANDALREEIRSREREVCERAAAAEAARENAVAHLMRDMAAEAKARARAEKRARALSADVQRKEEKLAGQTKIMLEMRSEKERLQDIIDGMQGTIDNIKKELTREAGPGAADHGNAPPAPRAEEDPDQFLSDSSTDADVLDPSKVNARFEALSRGEALPAMSFAQVKRELTVRARLDTKHKKLK